MLLGCGTAEKGATEVDGNGAPGAGALAIEVEVEGSGVQVLLVVGGCCATMLLPQHAHSARLSSDRSDRRRRVRR